MKDNQKNRREALIEQLVQSVLEGGGVTDSDLRRSVEAMSASLSGRSGDKNIPPLLETYVVKVAKHAYKVTDKGIDVPAEVFRPHLWRLHPGGYAPHLVFDKILTLFRKSK